MMMMMMMMDQEHIGHQLLTLKRALKKCEALAMSMYPTPSGSKWA